MYELCRNVSISEDLPLNVNWPAQIPDCDSHSSALLDLFLSPDASICSAVVFCFSGKFWSCCCLSFNWLFFKLKASFHSLYFVLIGMVFLTICLKSVLLLLLVVNSLSEARLELTYTSLIANTRSNLSKNYFFLTVAEQMILKITS